MSDVRTTLEIQLQSDVATGLEEITKNFKAMVAEFQKFAKTAEKGINIDPTLKRFVELSDSVKGVGTQINEIGTKAKSFGNVARTSADEARAAFASLDAEIRKVKADLAKGAVGSFGPGSSSSRAVRDSITGQTRARRAARDADALDFSAWRVRSRIKADTLKAESTAARRSEGLALKADMERSRQLRRSARGLASNAHGALQGLEHPWLQSPAFVATLGVGIAAAATRSIVSEAARIDDAATRYRMLAVPNGANAAELTDKARSQALKYSIGLGVDADKILDIQTKAIRDGISPEIARTLPKVIASAAHLMAAGGDGDVEGLTDKLAETVQQLNSMGWIKNATDARHAINVEAGISNFAGNSSAKMEEFTSGGGWGHGKELGWNFNQTAEMAALLNSSGERTGMASSRAIGQLSQNVPQMADKYRKALRSRDNSDENRAVRNAPSRLGYGSIKAMQGAILSGPEGFTDFAERLQKIDEKNRKLILKGYGFSEQLGAPLAEVTNKKLRGIKEQVEMLAAQKEDNDYLTQKFADWKTGIVFMIKQLEAGWKAIEVELGDVIKNDIIVPLRDWWVEISTSILNSGMKEQFHRAILGFVHGLGFDDVAALLKGITGHVHGFDIVGFATGIGEGIGTVATALKGLFDILSFGSGSAENIGKLAAEFFGFSIAAMALAPIIGIVGSFTAGLKALFAVFDLAALDIAGITGVAGGLKGLLSLDLAAGASGLMLVAGSIATLIGLAGLADKKGILKSPEGFDGRSILNFLDPNFGDLFLGKQKPDGKGGISKESYDGDGFAGLLHKTSWSSDGSDQEIKDAILSTAKSTDAIQDSLRRSAALAMLATIEAGMNAHGGDSDSVGGGGGSSGHSNMRYGRGSSGQYRGTPGGGGTVMGGGAGGSRSWRNNNPGNIEYGAYAKSMGATGTDGRFAVFPDYAAGRHAQEHLLFESKGYKDLTLGQAIGKWAPGSENNVPAYIAAMGGNANAKMSSFNPAQRSALLDAMQKHEGWKVGTRQNTSISSTTGFQGGSGNTGGAVDKAMSMLGMGESAAGKTLGAYMHSGEWCADFVNATLKSAGVKGSGSAMAASFSQWGKHVDMTNAQKGDVIEENNGGNSHVHHVGLATGNVQRDKNGNVTAVEMVSGNYGNAVRKNWEKVGIIADLRRSDEAVAKTAHAIAQQSRGPGGLSGSPASKLPEPQHTGAGGMTQAGLTNNHFHIHDATDPQRVADAVGKHLDRQMSSRAMDVSHAA